MKLRLIAGISTVMASLIALPAFANPDLYVVNFHQNDNVKSQRLSPTLKTGLSMAQVAAEEVLIDTSNAAKWEKAAHAAIDRQIVPVFNRWVGLPGFAAVVDAKTKEVVGCVNADFTADEIADELKKMAAIRTDQPYMSQASTRAKSTHCPAAFNKLN